MASGVGIYLSYDPESDILELVKNPDQPYVSREIRRGLFVHVEPKSRAIVGFAVHHFSRGFGSDPLNLPLRATFEPAEEIERVET